MSIAGGVFFNNPALNSVFAQLPNGQRAAYSQDIGTLLYFTSGQPLNTAFYPTVSPFAFNTQFSSFFDAPFNTNQTIVNNNSLLTGLGTTTTNTGTATGTALTGTTLGTGTTDASNTLANILGLTGLV